jgi:hypothetical protein
MLCDKHIVKMPLESAQLLCSPYPKGTAPYRRTHYGHPCAVWVRDSLDNYLWLVKHGLALCDEFNFRYKKEHKCREVINWCSNNRSALNLPEKGLTPFVLVMKDEYKKEDAVASYRAFYNMVKSRFAKWEKGRGVPEWYSRAT